MRQEVIVSFSPTQRHAIAVPADVAPLMPDVARRWLDDEFVANDCEPLRASGKVLVADKVLVLASTVGDARFVSDPGWATAFARATVGALARPIVRVDVAASAVTF
jgi:hypothetical protein